MWNFQEQKISSGLKYFIWEDSSPLSFKRLLKLLEEDASFIDWYSQLLAKCPFQAFYWENPPLYSENIDRGVEFVLLEEPLLEKVTPQPEPFNSYFLDSNDKEIIVFPNLGGDALLIVPKPIGSFDMYPHLAKFLRSAPKSQVRSLWHQTALTVQKNLGSIPKWLSTAGLGVAWLHIRLDSQPKYFRYSLYKKIVNF